LSSGEVLALLGAVPPSEYAIVVVAALQRRPLGAEQRVAVLSLWTRMSSWVTAQTDAAIVAVAGRVEPEPDDWTRDEVALAMRLSTRTSPARVFQARQRCGRLARFGAALAAGVLLPGQADDAVSELLDASAAVVDRVADRVLPGAGVLTRPQFGRALRKAVIAADAPAAALRHEEAKKDRGVWIRPRPDGMAEVVALMTAVEAVTYIRGLDAAAQQIITDYKTAVAAAALDDPDAVFGVPLMGPARCDAMLGWAHRAHADPTLPRAHGRRTEIGVTMTMDTYLGLTDDPAILDGYGPICAEQARELLPEATLRRLITDDLSGELLDYGHKTYRPPQHLEDHVIARSPRCLIHGCPQPARQCHLDHRVPFDAGGPTSADNLDPLCERHHLMKHKGGWQLLTDTTGNLSLITAAGVRYPIRREAIDPSFDGRDYLPLTIPDAALLERAIAHANIWLTTDAQRHKAADLEPPF
jgi:hypothetical protein